MPLRRLNELAEAPGGGYAGRVVVQVRWWWRPRRRHAAARGRRVRRTERVHRAGRPARRTRPRGCHSRRGIPRLPGSKGAPCGGERARRRSADGTAPPSIVGVGVSWSGGRARSGAAARALRGGGRRRFATCPRHGCDRRTAETRALLALVRPGAPRRRTGPTRTASASPSPWIPPAPVRPLRRAKHASADPGGTPSAAPARRGAPERPALRPGGPRAPVARGPDAVSLRPAARVRGPIGPAGRRGRATLRTGTRGSTVQLRSARPVAPLRPTMAMQGSLRPARAPRARGPTARPPRGPPRRHRRVRRAPPRAHPAAGRCRRPVATRAAYEPGSESGSDVDRQLFELYRDGQATDRIREFFAGERSTRRRKASVRGSKVVDHESLRHAKEDLSDFCASLPANEEADTCWIGYNHLDAEIRQLDAEDPTVAKAKLDRLEDMVTEVQPMGLPNLAKMLATLAKASRRAAMASARGSLAAGAAALETEDLMEEFVHNKDARLALMEQLFSEFDANHDGKISVREFRELSKAVGMPLDTQDIFIIYDFFGIEGGKAGFDEFLEIMSVGEDMGEGHTVLPKNLPRLAKGLHSEHWLGHQAPVPTTAGPKLPDPVIPQPAPKPDVPSTRPPTGAPRLWDQKLWPYN
ncbi:unnamed protein product [Pedinophyceae sp. YPF-701]|nr:unnamed protein product [Pedinophyceae sp. YPF-701]